MKYYLIKPRSGWIPIDFKEWVEFFDLFLILVLRDIKLRYKQTLLGVLWVVLQPLLTSLIFAVIFGKLAKMPSEGIPYVLFAFGGMLPWFAFSQAVTRSSVSVLSQSHLISKVYFPRIMIPAASCFAVLLDYSINLLCVLGMLVVYGLPFSANLLLIPFLTFIVMIISFGIGLLFSAMSVFYRDSTHILPFMMQVWMFACPLVYSASVVPEKWRLLYFLNPLSGIIDGFRWSLFSLGSFPWQSLGFATGFSFCVCILGVYIFTRVQRQFADVI